MSNNHIMKKKLIGVFLFMSLICGSVSAQGLPDRKETLKTLVKVNDYFMKKYAVEKPCLQCGRRDAACHSKTDVSAQGTCPFVGT